MDNWKHEKAHAELSLSCCVPSLSAVLMLLSCAESNALSGAQSDALSNRQTSALHISDLHASVLCNIADPSGAESGAMVRSIQGDSCRAMAGPWQVLAAAGTRSCQVSL